MTLYNPHLLPRQELLETFVARQPLLHELVDDLRRGGGQHHLLVGNRGSGKTTLLLRLAAAIEDDATLRQRCIPLRFPEEQYNVSRPSDFWMNAIDALVDALERRGDRSAARRLEATLSELDPLDEDERAMRSLAALEGWGRQAKHLIVLLVDNLDLVLDRLADSLWALREALSVDNGLVVIGASSKFIEEAINYESPFYDFFRVHELGPLSEDEARRVVLSLALKADTPKVAEILERDPGRFKALYVLTGGTPRTLALLHTVLALDGSGRIERDLDGLLDQLTPYYKARFDDLPSQSQVIVDKVALHWHPITAAACQAATHLDINIVSAQLNRLVKSGVLTKVALPDPGKLGFQVAERFFNIWYLMRASRRLRRRLVWLVEFLKTFYGDEELRRRAEELVSTQPAGSLDTPAKLLAFASAVADGALRRRLELRAIELLVRKGVTEIRDVLDLDGEDLHLAPVLDRVRVLQAVRTRIASSSARWPPGWSSEAVAERVARHPLVSLAMKARLAVLIDGVDVRPILGGTDYTAELGNDLMDAIGSGEIPALADVSTPDEIDRALELGASRVETTVYLLIATELARPLPDESVRHLLSVGPLATVQVPVTIGTLIARRPWERLRHLAVLVGRHMTEHPDSAKDLDGFASFFMLIEQCVSHGLVREAIDLLADSGLAARWAPLHEALLAVDDGQQARLRALAPEVRDAALELYEKLSSMSLSVARSRAADIASAPRPGDKAGKRSRGSTHRAAGRQRGQRGTRAKQ
jgi:energy-coupling factor transporter ATP-binding protein EcfA2